jgi:hypothetical protein
MKNTVNLTKVSGCYSKELRENCPTIKFMLSEPSVSTDEMINVVEAIIEPAFINADAKKRFLKKLKACSTKEAVDELCYDAVIHGMYYHPKTKSVVA